MKHTVLSLLALVVVSTVQGKDGCKEHDYLDCVKNKTFTGHVIKSFTVLAPGLDTCQHKCFLEDKCVSYNLGPEEGMTRTCELSDADNMTRPGFLKSKKDFEYYPIKNPCSSSPCPPGRLCTPDFSWDTFSCDDGGWTQWTSWKCSLPFCTMTRRRYCTNPVPQNKGANCSGSGIETKECYTTKVDSIGCESALGMEDRRIILDSQITASSSFSAGFAPKEGRLNNNFVGYNEISTGAWAPKRATPGEYLQVDLLSVKMITKIATQGRPGSAFKQWVTEYTVSYSNDANKWKNYGEDVVKRFSGNSDRNTIVTNKLEIPIMARYIRVVVQKWRQYPSMRLELYGCSLPAP